MLQIRLTPRARTDLEDIWNYTYDVWGEERANQYISRLYNKFAWLTEQPNVGKPRNDIAPNYRSFPQGEHVIFYMVINEEIIIIAVLHKNMDILRSF